LNFGTAPKSKLIFVPFCVFGGLFSQDSTFQ